jgi:hypothetical protein
MRTLPNLFAFSCSSQFRHCVHFLICSLCHSPVSLDTVCTLSNCSFCHCPVSLDIMCIFHKLFALPFSSQFRHCVHFLTCSRCHFPVSFATVCTLSNCSLCHFPVSLDIMCIFPKLFAVPFSSQFCHCVHFLNCSLCHFPVSFATVCTLPDLFKSPYLQFQYVCDAEIAVAATFGPNFRRSNGSPIYIITQLSPR